MPIRIDIRPLQKDDPRGDFSCGQADLDRFFHYYAGQNQFKFHLAVTYVAVSEAGILGFATVAVAALERQSFPDERQRKKLPGYPLPVLRLARLGVDLRAQGLGIGRALVRHVLRLAVTQRDTLGCLGVVTDAKPEAVRFYQGFGFVPLEVREGVGHDETTAMFLPIGALGSALE